MIKKRKAGDDTTVKLSAGQHLAASAESGEQGVLYIQLLYAE